MRLGKSLITKIINGLLAITIMFILMIIYSNILNNYRENEEQKITSLFKDYNIENYAYIDKWTIYGNHLNINGYINRNIVNATNIKDLKLVITNLEKQEKEYSLRYDINDENVKFELSSNINEGINLDEINEGEHYILLKIVEEFNGKEEISYYSLENITKYTDEEYYTLRKNNLNKKIDIKLEKISLKNNSEIKYMKLDSILTDLPNDVYDIVIDPGHGGTDPGAMYKDNTESKMALEYSIDLKRELESLGFKVKLTREKDEYTTPYGKNGRAIVPYDTKSKLFLSIHLNSTARDYPEGGVEIYCSNNMNLDMAKNFADNIVRMAKTRYSPNNVFKSLDGVYVKTYTEEDIKEAIEYAHDLNYEPYENLSTDTPYYFMIRETGGIMTHAYVDGRNKNIGDNPYYNSNISAEAYLLELGFINSENDLENLKKNKEAYISAIVKTIVDNYAK